MLLGVLFVLSSLGLTFYNSYEEKNAERFSSQVLEKLDMAQVTEGVSSIPDYVVNPGMDMPEKEIDGKYYVGTVSIPALGITLPVMAEWSYENFKISPCVYEGTPYKNDFIVCAHNYRNHFGSLKNLTQGDRVTFKDFDGNVFTYEVLYTEILDNNAVEEMSAGDWDMTLFTCTYGGATRVTVRCVLI
ncbi:MAG: sortase [Clostridia bacterium]|nr:sortase [Clostridia bacterium]